MNGRVVCPIIYVRGFAGGTSGIDSATDDPFYGFNLGTTHVRVDGDGKPQFYQYAGPLVRLMEDEDYRVLMHGGQQAFLAGVGSGTQPANSVWVFRFYDVSADTFGSKAVPYELLTAAERLLDFVDLVLDRTGAAQAWLVSHSMGGLVCRSMIQKVCPEKGRDANDLVGKFFAIAAPHNGIVFTIGGLNITVPQIAPFGAQIFDRDVMYRYLTPESELKDERPGDWDAHDLDGKLDPARVFCLVGTDAADYGLVSRAVGPKSDGLVQIDNAYVYESARAYVHRSHSGVYGEVNSEEAYQNLRRFFFGSRKVTAELVNARLPSSTDADVADVWQAEVRVSIRGLPVLLSEQTAAHYCPIELGTVAGANVANPSRVDPANGPVCLCTVYLLDPERARQMQRESLTPGTQSPRCRYFMHVGVLHLQQKHGLFFWQNHLETLPEWEDALIVDVGPGLDGTGEHVWAAWQSENAQVTSVPDPITGAPLERDPGTDGSLSFTVALPAAGQNLLGPGPAGGDPAAIKLRVRSVA